MVHYGLSSAKRTKRLVHIYKIIMGNDIDTDYGNSLENINDRVVNKPFSTALGVNELHRLVTVDLAVYDQVLGIFLANELLKAVYIKRFPVNECVYLLSTNKLSETVGINCTLGDKLIQRILLLNKIRKLRLSGGIVSDQGGKHVLFQNEIGKSLLCLLVFKHILNHRVADMIELRIGNDYLYDRVNEIVIRLGIIFLNVVD